MNELHGSGWNNLLRLCRFLAWYGLAVAALFLILPEAGSAIDGWYSALSRSARFFSVLGLFSVIAVWQVLAIRDRWRSWPSGKSGKMKRN